MIIILLLHSAAWGHYSPVSGSSGLSSYLCSRTIPKPSDGNHFLHHTTENSSALAPWALLQVAYGNTGRAETEEYVMSSSRHAWAGHMNTVSAVYSQRPDGGTSTIYRGHHHFCRCAGTPPPPPPPPPRPPPLLLLFLSFKVWRLLYGKITATLNNGLKH